MDFRASNAYTGSIQGYVFTTRQGRTGYYEDPQQPKTNKTIDAILEKADDEDIEDNYRMTKCPVCRQDIVWIIQQF